MQPRVLRGLVPWTGVGVGLVAVSTYLCGHAEIGVCLLACAVGFVAAGVLFFVALIALSWVVGGLWREIVHIAPTR